MAHRLLSPAQLPRGSAARKALAVVGVAGALMVPGLPGVALDGATAPVDQAVCDPALPLGAMAEGCVEALQALADAAAAAGATATPVVEGASPVVDALAPVAGPVADALAPAVDPVAEALPGGAAEGTPAEGASEAAPTPAGPGEAAQGEQSESAEGGSAQGGQVEAAGKAPTEVSEPQAPASGDGRVASGPTLQPASVDIGRNIPGVRSQNGVTLQPYDSPLVAVPMSADAPRIAGAPVTTSSPAAALVSEAISFTGTAVLPHATGGAAWVTATGLGLLGAAAAVLRRRTDALTATTLEER